MAPLLIAAMSAQLDSQLSLHVHQATRGQGLRQKRPAEAERVASKFPDGAQDTSSGEQEARNRTQEGQDTICSQGDEMPRECLERVIGEHNSLRDPDRGV